MICFQYAIDNRIFIIDNTHIPILNREQYTIFYHFISYFCAFKKINPNSFRVVFFSLFHLLILFENRLLFKIIYEDLSNIEEQYFLSQKSIHLGRIYDIYIVPRTNSKIITMEYISNILSKPLIFKQEHPFIFLYSLTVDYLKALLVLHQNNYIHSSLRHISFMVHFLGGEKKYCGKLVGLEDIIRVEDNKKIYNDTGGSINHLAPERYSYFEENGFFGMTSQQSDIWELFFCMLSIIDVIVVGEFFELLNNNFDILESYLFNKVVKRFNISWSQDCSLLSLVDKYVKTITK